MKFTIYPIAAYPNEEQLQTIKAFDPIKKPVNELFDYIESIWVDSYWGLKRTLHTLELHTGGLYGNEKIISALQQNLLFWSMYCQSSKKGGHYYFRFK